MIYTIGADVATLVQALQNPGDASKQRAVYALSLLTKPGAPGVHGTSAKLIAAAGGVHSLVELVRNGSASLAASATIVLAHLARSYSEKLLIGSEPNFIALLIEHAGAGRGSAAVRAIRALAHNHFGHRVAISDAGGVETLVALERRNCAIASDALRVLAQNDVIHAKIVAYRGGVPALYVRSFLSDAACEMYVHHFRAYHSIVRKCLDATVVPADLVLVVMAFLTGDVARPRITLSLLQGLQEHFMEFYPQTRAQ
jgi:hypothetical protein